VSKQGHISDGRREMPFNVAVSWAAQCVQIIAGFLVPRLIDRQQGQDLLGIWDLGWTMVSYLTLLEAGISSSVNRHVALFLSRRDVAGMNGVVSSVACMQRALGGVVLLLGAIIAWNLSIFLPGQPAPVLRDAQCMAFLLGTAVAVGLAGQVYAGVITGCHRWAFQHGTYAVTNVLSLVGMMVVLRAGYGLIGLAAVHLGCETLGRLLRAVCAYRVCSGLSIRLQHFRLNTAKKMVWFGGKLFLSRISQVVLNQTVSVMIASQLGPAALALFSRPRSLVYQVTSFTKRYAFMLVPTTAALHGTAQKDEIRRFAKDSSRYGLYISLPMIFLLVFAGETLLRVWMGERYANGWLIICIALGQLAEVAFQPLQSLLAGLNLHGRPGIATAIGAAAALALSWCVLHVWDGGLIAVAIAVGVPWTLARGVYVPIYACRRLEIPLWEFLKSMWAGPLACMLPYAVCLLAGRAIFPARPILALLFGGGLGGLCLAFCYWRWVLPPSWKVMILAKVSAVLYRLSFGRVARPAVAPPVGEG
jgi:O-antigen/teichoic acid export membrane protein